jgi:hypothetical protein
MRLGAERVMAVIPSGHRGVSEGVNAANGRKRYNLRVSRLASKRHRAVNADLPRSFGRLPVREFAKVDGFVGTSTLQIRSLHR